MSIITIATPFNIDLEFKIAAINKRFAAWAVDVAIISAYYFLMLRFIYPVSGMKETISQTSFILIIVIPVILYQLACELLFNGQTPGKMAVGIQVIDKEGREPAWGQYFIRWILCIGSLYVYIIPIVLLTSPFLMLFFMVIYLPDFLCMAVSSKSQRIGDFAAGTVVIDKNYRPNISETIYRDIQNTDYKPLYPQVMRLTDRDINGIRNLLNNRNVGRQSEHYVIDVAQKIKTVLGIESDLHAHDFLAKLLLDYNYFIKHQLNG